MSNDDRVPQSPKRMGNGTHANKVAELILGSCRMSDASAHISSVLRDCEGRTIVRMRTNPSSNPLVLLRAIQKLWPLAKCSVKENALDGTVEAEIIVPREKDERDRAFNRARKSRISELLWLLCFVMIFLALVTYANDCYTSIYNATATNYSGPSTEGSEGKSEL